MLPDLLSDHKGAHLVVRVDGQVILNGPQAVLVSNNPYETGDIAGIGRRARLDQGVLGVVGVKIETAAQAAGLLRRAQRSRNVTVLTAREVVIDADQPQIPVGIDGESVLMPTPVHCTIRPLSLRVRVPRDRPGVPEAATAHGLVTVAPPGTHVHPDQRRRLWDAIGNTTIAVAHPASAVGRVYARSSGSRRTPSSWVRQSHRAIDGWRDGGTAFSRLVSKDPCPHQHHGKSGRGLNKVIQACVQVVIPGRKRQHHLDGACILPGTACSVLPLRDVVPSVRPTGCCRAWVTPVSAVRPDE